MLVDESFRKCVTFLYADRTDKQGNTARVPIGSAFFVAVQVVEGADNVLIYAVTARHVVDTQEALWLRMRLAGGGFEDLPVAPASWDQHLSSDVAAAIVPARTDFDWKAVKVSDFASREFVAQHSVGEGDDVFFSGLFVGHYGSGAPQPIIRFGNVALMPREPVTVEISKHPRTLKDIEAYLVEARSWGGQSGSPAFWTFAPDRERLTTGNVIIGGGPPFALLGLVQGLWKDPKGALAPDPSGEGVVEVNMGISVVVPAYTIAEVLMSEEQQDLRRQIAEHEGITPGSLVVPEAASADEPSEFERFEALTRNLVNTPKPKDESES